MASRDVTAVRAREKQFLHQRLAFALQQRCSAWYLIAGDHAIDRPAGPNSSTRLSDSL
jgi:hypothetical protein